MMPGRSGVSIAPVAPESTATTRVNVRVPPVKLSRKQLTVAGGPEPNAGVTQANTGDDTETNVVPAGMESVTSTSLDGIGPPLSAVTV